MLPSAPTPDPGPVLAPRAPARARPSAWRLLEELRQCDPAAAGHSFRVARYCERMGRELGLGRSELRRLRLAGLLHDVGKRGIPRAVLAKPGPLDAAEWAQVRLHPVFGAAIATRHGLEAVATVILTHHERVDGRGYPLGLAGAEIPFEARVIAVADALDAMLSERPYERALPPARARVELERAAGTQFDEQLARLAASLI